MQNPFIQALFLDIPYLLDSAWRHVEFRANAECYYTPGPVLGVSPLPFWHKPPFWLFVLTVLFVSYGPTWTGLCSVAPLGLIHVIQNIVAVFVAVGSIVLGRYLWSKNAAAIDKRFGAISKQLSASGQPLPPARRWTVSLVTCGCLLILTLIGVWVGALISTVSVSSSDWKIFQYLFGSASESRSCAIPGGSRDASLRLMLCIVAIVAFAGLTSRITNLKVNIVAQGLILAVVSLVQWFLFPSAANTEASDLPYRHLFGVWAPLICLVIAAAPWVAHWVFKGWTLPGLGIRSPGLSTATQRRFAYLLEQTELFVKRSEPLLSWRRLVSALVYGPAYHPLQLSLLPSLVAFVAPANWLYVDAFAAFCVSFLLLVWGSISTRWQVMVTQVERWFLSGTPLFISLFVIVLAVLRLVKFDYVSTILDAVPFGMAFGFVLMNYALFWLVEYWLNRAAAVELLDVLGPVERQLVTPYRPQFTPHPWIHVDQHGRRLASHGTGRFAVVGSVRKPHPPAETAFQTYSLVELFAALGDGRGDHERVMEVSRTTGAYFFVFNALIFGVVAAFAAVFYYEHYAKNNGADPVILAQSATPQDQLVDLADLLQQQAAHRRPAIIVVGSGGGTRAALYTESVMKGLADLHLGQDIVLVSGVSGGGVALAYFAANQGFLTGQGSTRLQKSICPGKNGAVPTVDDEWHCYSKNVTQPFIEDVMNGATEWRIYRTIPLSELLADSFERRLLPERLHLGSIKKPVLILNSTIVGHPSDESDVLTTTLDPAKGNCDEQERPYSLMNGGRLIFTNLGNVDAFPVRASPIPDVRLPYVIVRDPGVRLAAAAALNANFPPVFPNARVRLTSDVGDVCPHRSYYVTDGGAEENLGLVSALYALQSALARYPKDRQPPPIHVVIAEASAVTYDYTQDRGVSAIVGGSRERITGGLTSALLEAIENRLAALCDREVSGPASGSRGGDQHQSTTVCEPADATRRLDFHYLALPLAFRARGGFGTHWMYADKFDLHDPRPRAHGLLDFGKIRAVSDTTATVDREALEQLWSALHDPKMPFCDRPPFSDTDAERVKGWICGLSSSGAGEGRDRHLSEWQRLVAELGPSGQQQQ